MDITIVKTGIWQQFGASIDYLEDTIRACPDSLWLASLWKTPDTKPEFSQFWYIGYHTLFWLNLYLTGAEEGFVPPPPFTLIEMDADGLLPDKPYTKDELLTYLDYCREQCQTTIETMTDETAQRHCRFSWGECSFFELLIYNQRHVHGHASQLQMLLGQEIGPQSNYVTQSRSTIS